MPKRQSSRTVAPIKRLPSADYLRACFNYDSAVGKLYWRKARGGSNAGTIAGSVYKDGYRYICIDYYIYKAHRIIWKLMTGEEPQETIDHRDNNRSNNRWCNLRTASVTEQNHNVGLRKNNTIGYRGIAPQGKKWRAMISINCVKHHIGTFDTAEAASAAYEFAARKLRNSFYHI